MLNKSIRWIVHPKMKIVINYSSSCRSKSVRPSFIFRTQIKIFLMKSESFLTLHSRACEQSGAWSERVAERAKYSRSAERVFIQRPERSLCLAPVPLRYRSHHEPRACTNPPRIHLCLQQLTKLSAYTSKIVRCEGEIWSS